MQFRKPHLFLTVLLGSLGTTLHAGVVADALFSFPAQTEYFEYDNLAALRKLPNYNTLRRNFSGKPLDEAKAVLDQLGIEEDQVQEIVTGSKANAYYGLVAGVFSSESVTKNPKRKRYASKLLDTQMYCTGREMCIVFLEDSLAAFGSHAQLRSMLLAREGATVRLTSNRDAVQLLDSTDRTAPVRGVIFGHELNTAVSSLLPDWGSLNSSRSRLTATLSGIGYSVTFDGKAHVNATLECSSGASAALLSQTLSALGTLQSVTSSLVTTTAGLPFQKVQVSSSGNLVHFRADTDVH